MLQIDPNNNITLTKGDTMTLEVQWKLALFCCGVPEHLDIDLMEGNKMNEKETKDRLTSVINAIMQMEVKGQSILIAADCIRELQNIITTPFESEDKEKCIE